MPRNLVLVGFMGSGKTAVGQEVAKALSMPFVDLDREIVARAGRSIAEIFREGGEPEFRRLEKAELSRVLRGTGRVVAPGGGAVLDDESWRRILDGNVVVYLRASPTALLRRIRKREERRTPAGTRPREIRPLADVDPAARHWPAAAQRRVLGLLEARLPRYEEAPLTVDTTGRRVDAVSRVTAGLATAAGVGR